MRMRPNQLLLLRQGEHPLPVEKIRHYDQREFPDLVTRPELIRESTNPHTSACRAKSELWGSASPPEV